MSDVPAAPAPAPAAPATPTVNVADIPVHPANRGLARGTDGKFLPPGTTAPEPVKAAEPAPVAAPVEPAPAPEPDLVSERFAAAAKKERVQAQTISQLQARLKELEGKAAAPVADPAIELRSAPLKTLAKVLGVSAKEAYDIITQQALSQDPESPPTPAELRAIAAEKAVEELRADLKRRDEDALKEARALTERQSQAVLNEFRQECRQALAAGKDKYELAANFATGDDVYQLINDHWNQQVAEYNEGKRTQNQMRILQIPEALQMMEEHFEKQVETGLKLKKVSAKVQPAPSPAPNQPSASAQPRAITQKLAPTAPVEQPAPANGVLSKEERLARAAAAFEANRSR